MQTRPLGFTVDGLAMEAELILPEHPRATVVLCHGIPSGSPPDPNDTGYAGFARTLAAHGFAAAWFNFRGAREAPGDFAPDGWARDLGALLDSLTRRAGAVPLIVVGSSVGGMIAITVAADRSDVAAVATLAAPATVTAEGLLPDPRAFLHEARNRGMIRDPAFPPDPDAWARAFDDIAAQAHIERIAPRPILLIHGDADDAVPYHHAERLFAIAGEPKELVRIPEGGHQLRRDPRAIEALVDWLDRRSSGRDVRSIPERGIAP